MSLEKVSTILKDADNNGYGIIAFNAFNFESISWLIETAEEESTPVIVMLYPAIYDYIHFSSFAAITKELACSVKVPVGLHFDHSNFFGQVMRGIKDGFTSVMIDGSRLEYEENIRLTAEVVKAARAMDVDVEAELGYVGAASNRNDFMDKNNFTEPLKAVEFIERTGVDSLAVAIGSAHGNYIDTPRLDFERLEEINRSTDIPLVLHGGTGIPDDQIKKAVKLGINKVNVGTEYNQIFYRKVREVIEAGRPQTGMLSCMSMIKDEIKAYLRYKIKLLQP